MNRKTLRLTDLDQTRDNCILFTCNEGNRIKYLAIDNGKFKIWTNETDIEKTSKDKSHAIMYYNNPDKFLRR